MEKEKAMVMAMARRWGEARAAASHLALMKNSKAGEARSAAAKSSRPPAGGAHLAW